LTRKICWVYPDGSKKGAMFKKYREAWWVMTGKNRNVHTRKEKVRRG